MPKKVNSKLLERMVRKYLKLWSDRFLLPQWPVYYLEDSDMKDRWGETTLMCITIDNSNAEVRIRYRPDLVPSEDNISRLVCHEMLHWLMDTMDHYVMLHLSKKSYHIFTQYLETIIEITAIALVQAKKNERSMTRCWIVEDPDEQ